MTERWRKRNCPVRGDLPGAVFQRLLARQFEIIQVNEPRAVAGSVKGLHDIRVALRRMRTLAGVFSPLAPRRLAVLDRRASKVCDCMGRARDIDVWRELFLEMDKAGGLESMPPQERRAVLAELRESRTRLAARALHGREFQQVKRWVVDCLEKPPPHNPKAPATVQMLAARRMREVHRQIDERYRKVGRFSSKPAHNLRRSGRRMRYLSEFFARELGRECIRAGGWITRAQAALGKMHDCDNALELSRNLPAGPARAAVRRDLKAQRKAYLIRFQSAWRHYAAKGLQKAWIRKLDVEATGLIPGRVG